MGDENIEFKWDLDKRDKNEKLFRKHIAGKITEK
jgi:hypothetical protein